MNVNTVPRSNRPFNTGKFGRSPIQKFKDWVGKKVKAGQKAKLKRMKQNLKRQEKATALKSKALDAKRRAYDAKTKIVESRTKFKNARLAEKGLRPGFLGTMARNKQTAIAKGEADVIKAQMEPQLYKKTAETEIQTKAEVAKTAARGRAVATAATALGGAMLGKSQAESKAKIAQAEADKATADAISNSLRGIKDVNYDDNSNSVAGLQTGVR